LRNLAPAITLVLPRIRKAPGQEFFASSRASIKFTDICSLSSRLIGHSVTCVTYALRKGF